MFSQRQFTPGKKSNARKIIYYAALNNQNYPNLDCVCVPDKYDKTIVQSPSVSFQVSNNMRISQIVKYSHGGITHFGNSYFGNTQFENCLGQSQVINYLGRAEGMPGGSGKPPLNKF